MVRRVISVYSKFFSSIIQLKPRIKMHAELQGMQSLLVDISSIYWIFRITKR